jgi:general L-amino acid transport system permease protein
MTPAEHFTPIPPRPAPVGHSGWVLWVRTRFFADWKASVLTVSVLALLAVAVPPMVQWALLGAVWAPDNAACRATHGVGACWGVVAEKGRLILFGRYPFEEQWRPTVACALLVGILAVSGLRQFWRPALAVAWVVVLAAFFVLMRGGLFGFTLVETDRWGGLPLTILLASLSSLVIAFPHRAAGGAGAALQAAGHPQRLHRLCGADPRCAADFGAVHGVVHVSAVHAAGLARSTCCCVCWSASPVAAAYMAEVIRGGSAGHSQRPGGSGARWACRTGRPSA